MFDRNIDTLVRVLTLATAMAVPIATSEKASAQEAITLETIGAVRMAAPKEAPQVTVEPDETSLHLKEQPGREMREASAH